MKQTRRILDTAAREWGTTPSARGMLVASGAIRRERTARGIERARWGAIFAAHARGENLRIPPIAPPEQMPACALAFAARVLARAAGDTRGGWDACGHWGLDGWRLRACWDEARRRMGHRFAVLLRWTLRHPGRNPPRVRSLSTPAALRALRACEIAFSTNGEEGLVCAKARAALGHLSALGQRYALRGAYERAAAEREGVCRRPVVRVRHLDWAEARRVESLVRATPIARRELVAVALARNVGVKRLASRFTASRRCEGRWTPGMLLRSPAYPNVTDTALAARLLLGARPAELFPGLTAREAHAWLLAGAEGDVAQGLARRLVGEPRACEEECPTRARDLSCGCGEMMRGAALMARDIPTARWLGAVAHDPARRAALLRERTVRAPDGAEHGVRYGHRVDEIRAEDLVEGERTGVEHAIERAAARFEERTKREIAARPGELARRPVWAARLPRCARLLNTGAELVAEGDDLGHCVASYAASVEREQCVILALNVRGQRSTVELRPVPGEGWAVAQHRGIRNADPAALCVKALRVIMRRIGATSVKEEP